MHPRRSKACEPCRVKKTRCDRSSEACSECIKRGDPESCLIRDKARPNRAPGRLLPEVVDESFVLQIERLAQEFAFNLLGLVVDLSLAPEEALPTKPSTTIPDIGLSLANYWLTVHLSGIHHSTPFIDQSQLHLLVQHAFGPDPNTRTLDPDKQALLYIVLALGSLRAETFDDASCQHHPLSPAVETSRALYQHAVSALDALSSPTEEAVQALFLLHTYASNTTLGRRSKDFVARAVVMAHELRLNRVGAEPEAARRRAKLYLYVYFSDVYLAALHNQPPLIKASDYDPAVFDPILTDSGSGIASFVDLVRVQGEVLERLSVGSARTGAEAVMCVLDLETRLDQLRSRQSGRTFGLTPQGDQRADIAGRLLRQIHFNWCRIVLRAPTIASSPLAHSSLAVCTRAACSLLWHYHSVCSLGLLNLPWMQLRRIVTAAHIVFISYWKGELLPLEATSVVEVVLGLCRILSTRWEGAVKVGATFEELAAASGLKCKVPETAAPGQGIALDEDTDAMSTWFLTSDIGLWDFSGNSDFDWTPAPIAITSYTP